MRDSAVASNEFLQRCEENVRMFSYEEHDCAGAIAFLVSPVFCHKGMTSIFENDILEGTELNIDAIGGNMKLIEGMIVAIKDENDPDGYPYNHGGIVKDPYAIYHSTDNHTGIQFKDLWQLIPFETCDFLSTSNGIQTRFCPVCGARRYVVTDERQRLCLVRGKIPDDVDFFQSPPLVGANCGYPLYVISGKAYLVLKKANIIRSLIFEPLNGLECLECRGDGSICPSGLKC